MSDLETFDQSDWQSFSSIDKDALRAWLRATLDFEPLAKAAGVGRKSKSSMIARGLAVEETHPVYGYTLNLTDKGWLAIEWLHGSELNIHPYGSFVSEFPQPDLGA